ncbi:MAG TPA: hypothetical protein VK595_00360 [Vicinamibacterales bacterium]|nr:hypothetical protein [Vicinamibacterales bacterium]
MKTETDIQISGHVHDAFAPTLDRAVGINIVRYGPGVLHLISSDIYLDIKFTSLTSGEQGGGGFSYIRSTPDQTPVPEPSTLLLVAPFVAGVVARARDRRRQKRGMSGA